MSNKITILWALSEVCNLNCEYCYFGIKGKRFTRANDCKTSEIINFIKGMKKEKIWRVYLAGGEPLLNKDLFEIVYELRKKDISIGLSTNGTLINKIGAEKILDNFDTIFVSYDSYLSAYHDKYRSLHKETEAGIKELMYVKKEKNLNNVVGAYTVLTRENIGHTITTLDHLIDLGVDYYVFQPIWLPANHPLYQRLSFEPDNLNDLEKLIREAGKRENKIKLPDQKYLDMFLASFAEKKQTVKNCLAGRNLFFIDSRGNIKICPSAIKTQESKLNITNSSFEQMVGISEKIRKSENSCSCYSIDCLPMWELIYANIKVA